MLPTNHQMSAFFCLWVCCQAPCHRLPTSVVFILPPRCFHKLPTACLCGVYLFAPGAVCQVCCSPLHGGASGPLPELGVQEALGSAPALPSELPIAKACHAQQGIVGSQPRACTWHDIEGIRTPAGRAQWISSPSP